MITYKNKKASCEDLYILLKECDNNFYPILSDRVNLKEYSDKLFKQSITFEAWDNNNLIGLIACYFNNFKDLIGFISIVCVTKEFMKQGICLKLIENCIEYAKKNNFKELKLEVHKENIRAIDIYKKSNFKDIGENNSFISMNCIV